MTNPNPLAQSVIDQINEIPGLDNVPAPGPNQKTNTSPAAADQPAETAYGVCHFPDNNLDAAIPVIKDWHAKVSEECRSDLAAILTDLQQTTANGQSQQRNPASSNQPMAGRLRLFRERGSKEYCAEEALKLLVKAGCTPDRPTRPNGSSPDGNLQKPPGDWRRHPLPILRLQPRLASPTLQ